MIKTMESAITLQPLATRRGVMSWIWRGEGKKSLCVSSEPRLQPDQENPCPPRKKSFVRPEARRAVRETACAGCPTVLTGRATVAVLGFTAALVAAGCHSGQNPSVDPYANAKTMTTASVEAARAAKPRHIDQHRDYARAEIRAADGSVTHGPLFFEDPLEETVSEDGRFAWSIKDYFYWAYGPANYLVDAILAPVSLIVTPPWQATVSDGNAEHRAPAPGLYDAKPRSNASTDPSTSPKAGSTAG